MKFVDEQWDYKLYYTNREYANKLKNKIEKNVRRFWYWYYLWKSVLRIRFQTLYLKVQFHNRVLTIQFETLYSKVQFYNRVHWLCFSIWFSLFDFAWSNRIRYIEIWDQPYMTLFFTNIWWAIFNEWCQRNHPSTLIKRRFQEHILPAPGTQTFIFWFLLNFSAVFRFW